MAASERQEQAGSEQYHNSHMGAIFKEGFSFSGYERDFLALNLGGGKYLNVSGVSGIDSISDEGLMHEGELHPEYWTASAARREKFGIEERAPAGGGCRYYRQIPHGYTSPQSPL